MIKYLVINTEVNKEIKKSQLILQESWFFSFDSERPAEKDAGETDQEIFDIIHGLFQGY